MKKAIALVICALFTLSLVVVNAQAVNKAPSSVEEWAKMNGVSTEEFKKALKAMQENMETAKKMGPEKYRETRQKLASLLKTDKAKAEKTFSKDIHRQYLTNAPGKAQTLASAPPQSLGTYGDILGTYNWSTSFSGSLIMIGHAAIVSTYPDYRTIESYPQSNSPIGKDGVQYYTNLWNTKSGVYLLGVNNASTANYWNAAKAAEARVGLPYNWYLFNQWRTDAFYCSQLVWRCWNDQGFNVDSYIPNTWVDPGEIIISPNTYTVLYKE